MPPAMPTIRVRLFAILRDRAGESQLTLDLPENATAADAAKAVASRLPAVADHVHRIAYAVNQAYAPASTQLHEGDEVALIPPVSGG